MSERESSTVEVFDDLADLFLADGDVAHEAPDGATTPASIDAAGAREWIARQKSVRSRSSTRAGEMTSSSSAVELALDQLVRIDALLVGHLPVATSPWLGQCAAAIARRDGAAAMIRAGANDARIDLYPAGVDRADFDSLLAAPAPATLDEARTLAAAWFSNWIIALPGPDSLLELRELTPARVVILTGADQAAVVAAFQMLKQIAGDLRSDTAIGVVIAGAAQDVAHDAYERLNRATRDFLGRQIELIGVTPRVEPTTGRTLATFEPVEDFVAWLNEAWPAARRKTMIDGHNGSASSGTRRNSDRAGSAAPPTPGLTGASTTASAADRDAAIRSIAAEAAAGKSASSSPAPTNGTNLPRREVKAAPTAAPNGQSRRTCAPAANSEEASLVQFVAGLAPLAVRSPRAPEAQFAIDERGRLHVLARDSAGDERLQAMVVAAEWAIEHLALLMMIDGRITAHVDAGEVVLHLFTNDPRRRLRLAGGQWKLHLLLDTAEAQAEPTRGDGRWTHVELT